MDFLKCSDEEVAFWPNVFCVGRNPCFDSQGDKISGSNICSITFHATSLFEEVIGILINHPPINVEFLVLLSGTGNIGINPILAMSWLVKLDHLLGIQDPSIITANFLLANSSPKKCFFCGFMPEST